MDVNLTANETFFPERRLFFLEGREVFDATPRAAGGGNNVLTVLNRELGADFDLDSFEHHAFYDADNERIDIRLRSLVDQRVSVPELAMEVGFEQGEEIRTELSCKFTPQSIRDAYAEANLELAALWTDPDEQFALSLARPRV